MPDISSITVPINGVPTTLNFKGSGGGGGGGDASAVSLTESEYEALSGSEKMNGKIYFVPKNNESGGGITPTPAPAVGIHVTTMPTKTVYNDANGINFDPSGIVVTMTDAAGNTTNVTPFCTYDVDIGDDLRVSEDASPASWPVVVHYDTGNVTYATSFRVTVYYSASGGSDSGGSGGGSSDPDPGGGGEVTTKILSSIAITTPPTKTVYAYDEQFSATGMVVTATYSDDTTEDVTSSCTITPAAGTPILNIGTSPSTFTITASYTYNGATRTATTTATSNPATYIRIATLPTKTTYNESSGYVFDSTGLSVRLSDSAGNETDVTSSCTLSVEDGDILAVPDGASTPYSYPIAVSYTSGGTTYTASFTVYVS